MHFKFLLSFTLLVAAAGVFTSAASPQTYQQLYRAQGYDQAYQNQASLPNELGGAPRNGKPRRAVSQLPNYNLIRAQGITQGKTIIAQPQRSITVQATVAPRPATDAETTTPPVTTRVTPTVVAGPTYTATAAPTARPTLSFQTVSTPQIRVEVPSDSTVLQDTADTISTKADNFFVNTSLVVPSCGGTGFDGCVRSANARRNDATALTPFNADIVTKSRQFEYSVEPLLDVETATYRVSYRVQTDQGLMLLARKYFATLEGGIYVVEVLTDYRTTPATLEAIDRVFTSARTRLPMADSTPAAETLLSPAEGAVTEEEQSVTDSLLNEITTDGPQLSLVLGPVDSLVTDPATTDATDNDGNDVIEDDNADTADSAETENNEEAASESTETTQEEIVILQTTPNDTYQPYDLLGVYQYLFERTQ